MTKETLASLEIELDTLKKELNTDYKVTTTFSVWLRNRYSWIRTGSQL